MSLLLHACCGPCLGGSQETVRKVQENIVVFWDNPNIHPYLEYRSRLEGLVQLTSALHLPTVFGDTRYRLEEFLAALDGEFGPARCRRCFLMRLRSTARRARELGCEAFSTTLLISPYQDRETLIAAGQEAATEAGIPFAEFDLRPQFPLTHKAVREFNLYKQKYCGCVFSERDRFAGDSRFALPDCHDAFEASSISDPPVPPASAEDPEPD